MRVCPVIFLNGPPKSGKDTLAKYIVRTTPGFRLVKFAKILKSRTHALYGCSDLPHDFFEKSKDEPNPTFHGLTPRQAYINVSERLMKPSHGTQIYGDMLVKELLADRNSVRGYVISDSGFEDEAAPVIKAFGADNCLLIKIVANKRGCSFIGDSRSYIELPIETLTLYNNGTLDGFLNGANELLAHRLQAVIGGA